jgi:flavin reductase (DIM6/NTAB) family NADH-FMN oxidoreductase RutF
MKKNIGAVNALYPVPVVIIGTEVQGKPNYITIANVGIIDYTTLSISIGKGQYSSQGIKEHMTLSINIPDEDMVAKTDYVGMVSGIKTDKSKVFQNFYGELKGAPMIKEAPVSMECEVLNIIDMPKHDVFFVTPKATYCRSLVLSEGKINLSKVRPILFDVFNKEYRISGDAIATCWSVGTSVAEKLN